MKKLQVTSVTTGKSNHHIKNLIEKHEVSLSDIEYEKLKNARNVLTRTYEMEVLYDQIIETFVTFKSKMHEFNIRSIQRVKNDDYIHNHEIRSSLNRLAFNILNFSKLYLDKHCFNKQKQSYILKVTGCSDRHNEVLELYHSTHETNKEYALGCALRNVAQHQSLPIDTFNVGLSAQSNNALAISRFTVPLKKDMLSASECINKKLLSKFEHDPDLHVVLDRYIYAIGTFHCKNRELASSSISDASKLIKKTAQATNDLFGLNNHLVELVDGSSPSEEETVFTLDLSWYEVVNYLIEKNNLSIDCTQFQFDGYLKPKPSGNVFPSDALKSQKEVISGQSK
ncbi:hypothetical protein VA249_26890 [Vibrio alfacsensis]|uniref:hypothetical protein n=1 Tax=Vibrio alfacsensis TaxID=1074311 RepID=UPI001BEF220B|nr:hypothetical protein [Vibrio alfacsensis]BBM63989.1 hypothetical protein VA249_06350 [Vibrio alfacsensis]BBM64377.1 hypothetical protein VA249_10230 [Vibrio alfacsensis]BBM65122.1 hypothetical protein VA249_17680 [Vibrio alfacsensis]BBM66043.1 hypothetical protein VA249_26890 [Vibrio alfacsensis]